MAKYQVKRGDTLPQIATKFKTTVSRLKELNKVYSVSRGQEIEVPSYPGANSFIAPIPNSGNKYDGVSYYPNMTGYYAQNYADQTIFAPRVPTYQPARVTSQQQGLIPPPVMPGLSPNNTAWPPRPQITPVQPQPLQTYPINTLQTYPFQNASSPMTQQQYMSQFPGQGYISPAVRQQQYMSQFPSQGTITNNGVTVVNPPTQAMTPQRPQGTYTGNPQGNANDAAWVNYWNWQAANPSQVTPQAPQVMTKSQIWEMKKRARVAKREQEQQEGGGGYQNQYTPFFTGNNVANLALRAR